MASSLDLEVRWTEAVVEKDLRETSDVLRRNGRAPRDMREKTFMPKDCNLRLC